MKKQLPFLILISLFNTAYAQDIKKTSSEAEQVGYSFGYLMGRNHVDSLQNIDLDEFSQGLKAAAAGEKSKYSDEEMGKILTKFKRETEAKELIELKKKADLNNQLGRNFLAENLKQPNIQTTSSGLQYMVQQAGHGKSPKKNAQVQVHYEGRLIDGTVFDSSIAREQPVEFRLDQVIQGWTEGLQLMKEGAKYRFFIPAELGYGQIGSGDIIEPNSTLIFDVHLIKILK